MHEELFSKRCFGIRDLMAVLELRERKAGCVYFVHREDVAWFYVRRV